MLENFVSTPVGLAGIACIAVAAGWYLYTSKKSEHSLPLPPGPKRLPYIGNLLQLASSKLDLWEQAKEWGKTYGDLVYIEVAGFPMLILNTQEAAVEALTKRSAIYSTRPQYVMPNLGGWDWTTPMLPYGERLRKHRQLLHKFFNSPTILNYTEDQERLRYVFLKSMLQSPEHYDWHVRKLPGIVLMMNAYGHDATAEDDKYMQMGEECFKYLVDFMNYLYLDLIPWLKYLPSWFPGGGFHKVAQSSRELSDRYKREIYDLTLSKMREGTARKCMTTMLHSGAYKDNGSGSESIADDADFMDVTGMVFLAGGDTTSTALMSLMLALLKFPEVQKRAQEEIDRVIGGDRLPTFEDRENLPYINALCIELWRWNVIDPTAIPHRTTSDDVFRGYHIPEGTIVVPNAWAISTDEKYYPRPYDFVPERWLPDGVNYNSLRPQEFVFGYGRRTCPGRSWAEHMVYITAASLLASFTLERAVDQNGVQVPLNEKRIAGALRFFDGPSKCKAIPRSEKIVRLIREHVET